MFARTARLTLRPAWREDAPMLAAAIGHESVATMLAHVPWPYDVGDALAFAGVDRTGEDPTLLIFAHEGGTASLVGGIGIARTAHQLPELGYWITPSVWGRGYATEAGRAMIAIARDTLRMPRLGSGHFVDNPASAQVLRKLGFRPTGAVEQRRCAARGRRVTCAIYALDLAGSDDEPVRKAA